MLVPFAIDNYLHYTGLGVMPGGIEVVGSSRDRLVETIAKMYEPVSMESKDRFKLNEIQK